MSFESIKLYKGQEIDYDSTIKALVEFGYTRCANIAEVGDFSARGGILDIFPPTFEGPIRIELQDKKIDTIRSFSLISKETLEEHAMVIILPKLGLWPKRRRPLHLEFGERSPLESFVDIKVGDYVVHVDHGIGVFRGIEKIKIEGGFRDYIVIEYADKDILYVPCDEIHLIQKYIGFDKRAPKLCKLGTKIWNRCKERAKKAVKSFAFELLELQAARSKLEGFEFSKDTDWQKKFEEEFEYPETPDQIRASIEAKKDMEVPRPMDRLLCGDVGYGKTEVALRTAFKAVMDNKQVAMLVPTTILAEQHLVTFRSRLKNFPVTVEMLSRFKTPSQVCRILKGLRDGSIDIIIGTHMLLRKEVEFKDLGLVIIDEEQRFGVRDKESLKKMRLLVDVLTLTATPIPRTLYMSLMGARDMSIIQTPPQDRLPVETRVSEYNEELIREAILRELSRDGQVFFVHNRINGIEKVAQRLHRVVPEARLAVAYGRMNSSSLEEVMKNFIQHNIDCLVSTAIIESGIDIPNANTLIVNRADMFGLADLYQLRGRVGRFKYKAYAYFLVPKGFLLGGEAERRLRAIERYTELGSGFRIAMEDLEIRGAGNILGEEQHGYISAVGFDLYCRLLREAVARIKERG